MHIMIVDKSANLLRIEELSIGDYKSGSLISQLLSIISAALENHNMVAIVRSDELTQIDILQVGVNLLGNKQ